jgi:hypothetical protein
VDGLIGGLVDFVGGAFERIKLDLLGELLAIARGKALTEARPSGSSGSVTTSPGAIYLVEWLIVKV